MKNDVLKILMMSFVATATLSADGRPEVSICQPSDTQKDGQNVQDPILARSLQSRALIARLSHDNETVMKNFDMLASEIDHAFRKEKILKADEVRSIFNAIDFAAEKHRLQMRKNKDKTPYISHPLGVTYNVMHYGDMKDADVIIGALLHDTVEDTQTTLEEVQQLFGAQVATYVREVTDNKKLDFAERKRIAVIDASKKSKGAAQIELADKLYNVEDLLHNPPENWRRIRIERYYQWVQAVVERLPNGNEVLKKQIHSSVNAYWEQQKATDQKSR